MWASIGAWLLSTFVGDVLAYLQGLLTSEVAGQTDVATTHATDDAQSQQDTSALQAITPTSTASAVDQAADDATKSL